MISHKKYFIFFGILFITILPGPCFGQRQIILNRSLIINCLSPDNILNQCDYGLLVPADIPGKQEIKSYTYSSLKPNHVTKTDSREYFLKWKKISFSELKKSTLEVSMKIQITAYDLKTAKIHPIIDKTDLDTLTYLKDEENFRIKAKNIKEVASKINGTDREETVKGIFDFVMSSLDYHIFFFQDRGAKQALKEGKGDCTEYSELMVTLCRAKKIPARIVMGLIPQTNGVVGYHNWVEVYFPQYGWVAFDPTWADHPESKTSFYTMKNTYVQLSNKRFIQTILCPCYGTTPFTIALKDTSIDLSPSGILMKKMFTFYNNFELSKADVLLDSLLIAEPDNSALWSIKALLSARQNNFDKGYIYLQNSLKTSTSNSEKASCFYAFANYYALKEDAENAIKYLKESFSIGFSNYKHFYADKDFDKIRNESSFVSYINEIKAAAEKAAEKK